MNSHSTSLVLVSFLHFTADDTEAQCLTQLKARVLWIFYDATQFLTWCSVYSVLEVAGWRCSFHWENKEVGDLSRGATPLCDKLAKWEQTSYVYCFLEVKGTTSFQSTILLQEWLGYTLSSSGLWLKLALYTKTSLPLQRPWMWPWASFLIQPRLPNNIIYTFLIDLLRYPLYFIL